MADDLLLGVDVGTTAVKAAVFDTSGQERAAFSSAYPTTRSDAGIVEQDPADWMAQIYNAIAVFALQVPFDRIRAVGITSQVNSHVFVDAEGHVLAPAIIWQDGRCSDIAAELDAGLTESDRMKWWGAPLPIDASHALSRMAWMAKHRPDIWERTHAVVLPKDFIIHKLTGIWIGDPISNIGLVDKDLRYIDDLIALVPGARDRLVPLRESTEVAGTINVIDGLNGVPVSIGVMDAWAGMLGVGVRSDGDAMYLSGTSEILGIVSPEVVPEPGVLVFPKHQGMTLHAGPTQSGGASIDWFCKTFKISPAAMAEAVACLNFEKSAPLFLPHLEGERAPLWDAKSRGSFFGISSGMGMPEMARAVFEGVACSTRLLFEALERSAAMKPAIVNGGGGGFKSNVWNQIRADLFNRPFRRLAVGNPGVLGAAAIGAVAAGLQPDLDAVLKTIVRFDRTFEPDPLRRGYYDDLFGLYEPAFRAAQDTNHALSGIARA